MDDLTSTIEHGYLGYASKGCRCKTCREAKAAYMREYRRRGGVDQNFSHGLAGYTDRGCRCEVCVKARRESEAATLREHRARKTEFEQHNPGQRYVAPIPKHGGGGYDRHSCRCDLCHRAKRRRDQRSRRLRGE